MIMTSRSAQHMQNMMTRCFVRLKLVHGRFKHCYTVVSWVARAITNSPISRSSCMHSNRDMLTLNKVFVQPCELIRNINMNASYIKHTFVLAKWTCSQVDVHAKRNQHLNTRAQNHASYILSCNKTQPSRQNTRHYKRAGIRLTAC